MSKNRLNIFKIKFNLIHFHSTRSLYDVMMNTDSDDT